MTPARKLHTPEPLDVAPIDWSEFSDEERAEIEAAIDDARTGRVELVPGHLVSAELQADAVPAE